MVFKQLTISDILNDNEIPIGCGDYVEHISKPGIPLLVVQGPVLSVLNHYCIGVKDQNGKIVSVRLDYVKRI